MKASGASVRKKGSLIRSGLKFLAILTVAAGFGLAAEHAEAAHAGHGVAAKSIKEPVTSVAAKDVETTSSIETNSANDPQCDISRKRLFVEGEGWIVRRVTTCY